MSNLYGDQKQPFNEGEPQSKLSSLFSDPPSKPADLKFVPPKEPMLRSTSSEGVENIANVVLFANPVELFLYRDGSTKSQGRVMCCIVQDQKEKNFSLLLYRSKQHPLIQTNLHSSFSILVQPNNYAAFSDDKESKWSIHVQGQKFREFLIQVGICRALSSYYETPTLGPNIVQNLTIGEGLPFQEGDTAKLIYSSWNVEKSTKGQIIEGEKEMKVKLSKSSDVWLMGLIGAQINLHRVIFVPNKMPSDVQLIAHEVIVKKIKKKTLSAGSSQAELKETNVPLKQETSDVDVASKQTLKMRMAKVGHPILPPKSFQSNFTDSDGDIEECKEVSPSISMSSSIEEICSNAGVDGIAVDKGYAMMTSANHLDFAAGHQVPFSSGITFKHNMPPGPMVAYTSVPYQQPMPNNTNDPVLSLLLSESRSQNTELRIALSRVTDKVDEIYTKVKTLEDKPASSPPASPHLMKPNPQELLKQITTIVTENESMKSILQLREMKCDELTGKLTDVVMKNHKLLEEREDLIERANNKSASLQELSDVKKESESIVQEMKTLKGDYDIMKERLEKRENDYIYLQEEFNEMQRELRASEASSIETVKSLSEQITKLKVDISIHEEQLAEAENHQKKLSTEEAMLKETIEEQRKQFEDKIKEEQEKHDNILSEEKGWYQDELSTIKRDFDKHLKLFEDKCEQRIEEEKEQCLVPTANTQEIETLKEQVESLTSELDLQRLEISRLKTQKSTIEEQLVKNKTSMQNEFEALISEINSLKTERESIVSKLNSCTAQCTSLENELDILEKAKEQNSLAQGDKETTSQFVKLIMNAVYREAKRTFDVAQKYDGVDVIQKLLIVIRDTTLLHLNPPKPARRSLDGKKMASVDEAQKKEVPTSGEDVCLISIEPDPIDARVKFDPLEPPPLPPPLFSDGEDDNWLT